MEAHPTLVGNARALNYYVTSRGQLTPQQCLRLAEEDTFALERRHSWTRWAYVAVALATLVASALKPWGFAA